MCARVYRPHKLTADLPYPAVGPTRALATRPLEGVVTAAVVAVVAAAAARARARDRMIPASAKHSVLIVQDSCLALLFGSAKAMCLK